MTTPEKILLLWLAFWNVLSLILMGVDKGIAKANQRAREKGKREGRRIPEKTLFLTALVGGSVGSLLGMTFFHHKTRHRRFTIGMPAIFALHVVILAVAFYWLVLVPNS